MNNSDFLDLLQANDAAGVSVWLKAGKNLHWLNEKNNSNCTPFMWACDQNHTDLAFKMLDAGATAKGESIRGWTPLAWAAWNGNEPLVERLIAEKSKVDAATKEGLTPFMIAAQNGHQHLMTVFKAAGANVHHRSADQVTALHLASRYGRAGCLQALLDVGLQVDAIDCHGNTPLMFSYDAETAYKLMDEGANIEAKNASGKTALHHAAMRLNHAVADALLWRGANVDAVDDSNDTPIAHAFMHRRQHLSDTDELNDFLENLKLTLEALLDAQPNLEIRGNSGRTVLMRSCDQFATQMLLSAGANVNAKDNDQATALMLCFLGNNPEMKNIEIAETLIAAGARVNDLDRWNTTCLCMAGKSNQTHAVRMLVEKGAVDQWHDKEGNGLCMYLADTPIDKLEEIIRTILPTVGDLNRRNEEGKTLLMLLAQNDAGVTGHNVGRAIELGADPSITTKNGWTALTSACVLDGKDDSGIAYNDDRHPRPRDNLQIVKDLLAGGADPLVIDDRKNTLLHHAARTGSSRLITLLASLKIPFGVLDEDKMSALDLARQAQNYPAVRSLMEAGVSPVNEDGSPVTKLPDLLAMNDDQKFLRIALDTGLYDLDVRMRVIGKCAVNLKAKAMVVVLDAADPEERAGLRSFALSKIMGSDRKESEKDAIVHTLKAHGARAAAHALLEECGMGAPAP